MTRTDRFTKIILLIIAFGILLLAIRPYAAPEQKAWADSTPYDHVMILSATFLYQGGQGVLAMDKRNGNVWFFPRGQGMTLSFGDPQFVVRLPLDKLDKAPQ